jgi:hypothetical protein
MRFVLLKEGFFPQRRGVEREYYEFWVKKGGMLLKMV